MSSSDFRNTRFTSTGNWSPDALMNSRKKTRDQRFSLFRTTAPPTLRGRVHPQRSFPVSFGPKLRRSQGAGFVRWPFFNSLRKSLRRERTVRRGLLATHFNCQPLAAFGATAIQNVLSVFRCHASAETMRRFAAPTTRLVRAFHLRNPSKRM